METENIKQENSPLKSPSRIFIPSTEWKVVNDDDVIFNGLHYRINMATGLKEAKLMDGSDGSKYLAAAKHWLQAQAKKQTDTSSHEAEGVSMQEYKEIFDLMEDEAEVLDHDSFLASVKEIDDSHSSVGVQSEDKASPELKEQQQPSGSKFRTYEELKQELADLNLIMESEQNVVAKKILLHLDLTTADEEIESLTDLEYLLHNSDNALAFIDNGGFERVVLPSLTSSSVEVRLLGCRLVSACVQNFAKGQIAAYEAKLLNHLVTLLIDDQETSVKSAALSGIGSLVRHFPLAQQQLMVLGQEALRVSLFGLTEDPPAALRWKMVRLLSDLLAERHGQQDEVSPERLEQLAVADLETSLTALGWCQFLVQEFKKLEENFTAADSLKRQQRSALEALLQAVQSSGGLCGDDMRSALPHLRLLQEKLRGGHQQEPHQDTKDDASDDFADGDEAYETELANRILRVLEMYDNKDKDEL
ncbi:Armadillo-type fold [Trinorchestia longiramus]|nr:Armadillo-type fold [Trinorchestia longiramus]